MTRNKKIGIVFIILPPFLFIGALVGYAITASMVSQLATGYQVDLPQSGLAPVDSSVTSLAILRVVFGVSGILGVLGFFVFIPIGIFFLAKDEKKEKETGA